MVKEITMENKFADIIKQSMENIKTLNKINNLTKGVTENMTTKNGVENINIEELCNNDEFVEYVLNNDRLMSRLLSEDKERSYMDCWGIDDLIVYINENNATMERVQSNINIALKKLTQKIYEEVESGCDCGE